MPENFIDCVFKIGAETMSLPEFLSHVDREVSEGRGKELFDAIGEKQKVKVLSESQKAAHAAKADELGFEHPAHLLNAVNQATGNKYETVEDIPQSDIEKTMQMRQAKVTPEEVMGGIKDKSKAKQVADNLRKLADDVRNKKFTPSWASADLPEGTQKQGADMEELIAKGIELVANGIEAGDEAYKIIKEAVEGIHLNQNLGISKREIEKEFKDRLKNVGLITPERKIKKVDIKRMIKPDPERVTMTESQGLKKQVRDFARGYKEGLGQGMQEGKTIGLEKGEKEGYKQGIRQGTKEGKLIGFEKGSKEGYKEGMKEGERMEGMKSDFKEAEAKLASEMSHKRLMAEKVSKIKQMQKDAYQRVAHVVRQAQVSGILTEGQVKKLLQKAASVGSEPKNVDEFVSMFEAEVDKANNREANKALKEHFDRIGTPRDVDDTKPPTEQEQLAKVRQVYSVVGAIKTIFSSNLGELKSMAKDLANWDIVASWRKFANSGTEVKEVIRPAVNKIVDLVGNKGWQMMREAIMTSRLQGARDRHLSMADEVLNMTDREMEEAFSDPDSELYKSLSQLSGLGTEPNPAAHIATNLIGKNGKNAWYMVARRYASDVLYQAAENVPVELFEDGWGKKFSDIVKDGKFVDPKMQQAFEVYKNNIADKIADYHAKNEGVFSDSLGELDTYYPLVRVDEGDNPYTLSMGQRQTAYSKKRSKANNWTSGQGESYDPSMEALNAAAYNIVSASNKNAALRELRNAGLMIDDRPNMKAPKSFNIKGKEIEAVKVATGQNTSAYVPINIADELKPILEGRDEDYRDKKIGKVFGWAVAAKLWGIQEPISHAYRLVSASSSMPFMQEWAYKNGLLGKAGGYAINMAAAPLRPFIGMITTALQDPTSESFLKSLNELVQAGGGNPKMFSKTWSKEFSEASGAKQTWDLSPMLYGRQGFDTKMRVKLWDLAKAMNPEGNPELWLKSQKRLGTYVRGMQGTLERTLKDNNAAPFASFGMSFIRGGIRMVFGLSELPIDYKTQKGKFLEYKAGQLITGGILSFVAQWVMMNKLSTGKYPWEDDTIKFGKIRLPESAKENPLMKKMFLNEQTGEMDDINLGALYPMLDRGLRATGLPKAYDTYNLGGDMGQAVEAGATQSVNTLLSPIEGNPTVQFGTTAAFGAAPYITAFREADGGPGVSLYRKVKTYPSGLPQMGANLGQALLDLNPIVGTGANMFGLNPFKNSYDSREEDAMYMANAVFNTAFPNLMSPHGNDIKRERYLQYQRMQIKKKILLGK